MNVNAYFSECYSEARQRFLDAAKAAGAQLDCLEIGFRGPHGEILAIDIAWLGSHEPRRALLHSTGLHGVEGFAGSAIQIQALRNPPALGLDQALILVHVLNPYGMAWLRRVNEENVDLNRNFSYPDQATDTALAYHKINKLLNPDSPPRMDFFLLRAILKIIRYGLPALKQAVAAGQYDYPKGLFYGGKTLQSGPFRYCEWLKRHLTDVERVLVIDVHTGLGPPARESLFLETVVKGGVLRRLFKLRPLADFPYQIQGGMCTALPNIIPSTRLEALTQEFGTYSTVRVLHALREENRWHHYGDGALQHPSKRRLLRMFYPCSPAWKSAILKQGSSLLELAVALLGQ